MDVAGADVADVDFADVVAAHGRALVRTAYLLCHDAGRAEDLAQEALLKAHTRWARHGTPDHPGAYLRPMDADNRQGEPVTVDGRPAWRLEVAAGGPSIVAGGPGVSSAAAATGTSVEPGYVQVQLPEAGVVVTITAPDRAAEQRVLDAVRCTPVDGHGCAAALNSDPVPPTLPSGALDPTTPTSGVICEYDAFDLPRGLVGSRVMNASDLAALAAFDAAVPWSQLPDNESVGTSTLLYRLTVADGTMRTIAVEGGNAVGVTDGTHRAQIPFDELVSLPTVYRP